MLLYRYQVQILAEGTVSTASVVMTAVVESISSFQFNHGDWS